MSSYNEQNLLDIVKSYLGYPFNPIELSDQQIQAIFVRAIRDYSKYYPVKDNIILDPNINGVAGDLRRFKIVPPQPSMSLISVTDIQGYPFAVNDIYREIGIGMYDNDMLNGINKFIVAYEMRSADELILLNNYSISTNFVARCKFTHAMDMSTVPFKQLESVEIICTGYVAAQLIAIRSMYNSISTPLGEVNLNLDYLEKLVEAKDNKIEELKKAASLSKFQPLRIA